MKHHLPAAALLLTSVLLLGGCAAESQPAGSAQPKETLIQEQINAVSGKYGLEFPIPYAPPMGMGWGWSIKNPRLGLFSPFFYRLSSK